MTTSRLCFVLPLLSLAALTADAANAASSWQGYARQNVSIDGRAGFVTQPKIAAPGA